MNVCFLFRDQHYKRNNVFLHYKSMSALTREFLVWNVNFSKNNGTFAFTEGWSKVVANLCLSKDCILLFKQVNPYNYILTPFFKETPYPLCDPGITLFISISSLPNRKYIESFCHVFNDQSVNTLLLPTYVKNIIGLGKLRRPMKVHLNPWDSLDVFVEKDSDSKCYFFTDGWNNIVQHLGVRNQCMVVLRYLFDYNFQLTLFDVNGSEVVMPRIGLQVNSDPDLRTSTHLVNNVDDVHHDVDMNSDRNPERLSNKVASMARVDVSRKMTIQNLAGVDTVVTFRPEKHGEGFRYVANGWRTNFTKPNGINTPQRCTFVYSPDADKLILKKVSK
ncbi:putative transcription factor B3-Domain family [Helianthus annuus]|nr:putative transcription factor B3-Domain family [Helianthus annuus]KAJ0632217.1 putative transcription factor B3-Domain family [Helianthus annuus]KAJ0826091.1 putative transcription factor B3-Domain family [Helianthus annuus]